MDQQYDQPSIRLALPKGRMQDGVLALLAEAGIKIQLPQRGYRPEISLSGYEVKLLKPQNIIEMLHHGSRDLGFAGADWVAELDGELIELLDTGLDPVRLVAAAPFAIADKLKHNRDSANEPITVASEYTRIASGWINKKGWNARLVRSYGATEVFPPEDADCIIDNTATGSTLSANGLEIIGEVLQSSTRLYCNPIALRDPKKRDRIENFSMLIRSVLEARTRVMLELNVQASLLDSIVQTLPSMQEATVSQLHDQRGYAVKAAVPRTTLPSLIPLLKRQGGTDIVISSLSQIIP